MVQYDGQGVKMQGNSLEINKSSTLSSATSSGHMLSHAGDGNNIEPTFELDEHTLRSLQQFIDSHEFQTASQSSEQVQRVMVYG